VFSRRTPADLSPNRLAALRADHPPSIDLTRSNPTEVGLDYPHSAIADAVAAGARRPYRPAPRGLPSARAAVADYYRARGLEVAPERVLITASSSEAYGLLFALLCDPGQAVLVPRPGYPLFDQLAASQAVDVVPYRLAASRDFEIDVDRLELAVTDACRALAVVSPNNPTGTVLTPSARDGLLELADRRRLALIEDAVFADYPAEGGRPAAGLAGQGGPLRFTLGGLSKAAGMPQLKLGWVVVSGEAGPVGEAIARWELLADAQLSVAGPVQEALAALLAIGDRVRDQIAARVRRNRAALGRAAESLPGGRVRRADGGWYGVVELPAGVDEEALCARLLVDRGVYVHPGYFYDFERSGQLVVSLLCEPASFDSGVGSLIECALSAI
jgi:aspartate/methionine/tyrosine aminotransferase